MAFKVISKNNRSGRCAFFPEGLDVLIMPSDRETPPFRAVFRVLDSRECSMGARDFSTLEKFVSAADLCALSVSADDANPFTRETNNECEGNISEDTVSGLSIASRATRRLWSFQIRGTPIRCRKFVSIERR